MVSKDAMKPHSKQYFEERKIKIIRILSYLGLIYAVVGWLDEVLFHWSNSILLSHYSEYIAIGIFGTYRVIVEKNPYTRKRIATLTAMVIGFWGLLPYLFALGEPALGYFSGKATWGRDLHTPMTLTFFLALLLVVLFGRRAVCSWNCPCVGTRDTMGDAFRQKSIKSEATWKLRHLKWLLTGVYFILFIIVLFPFSKTRIIVDNFSGIVGVIYFGSFLVIPITGNRNWCRWLCPFGGTFGILNKVGLYKIKADRDKCASCKECIKGCDMGIPIRDIVKTKGEVNVVDCVGCGRCVTTCPENALRFYDVRDLFRKIPPPDKGGLLDDEELDAKEVRIAASISKL
jgi:ferredoxin